MSLDNLTVGDLRLIIAALPSQRSAPQPHPFVGEYCICRASGAGVHAGHLVSATQCGDCYEVLLSNSRRLWSWSANGGVALSGVAVHGLKSGKIDAQLGKIAINGVVEIIPCTALAIDSINAA